MKKSYSYLLGIIAGLLNGFFGSGGGVAAVPMLEKGGILPRSAHATSIAITSALSVVSVVFYLSRNSVSMSDALILIPSGVLGAILGSMLLRKIPVVILKRIFGGLLAVSAIRLFFV